MTEYIAVNSNNLITSFVWSGLLDRAKCGELLEIIKQCSVEIVSIEVLQEIRQEIDNIQIYGENDPSTYQRFVTGNQIKQMILEIIDTHISAWSGKEDG